MPLDAVCINALERELTERVVGGKIDKVQQPERDMLLLSLRANGRNLRLLLAAGTGNARIHLTEGSFENPGEPPMFCMLMRKHLVGARILAVRQPDFERMLILELETHDELGVTSSKQLVVEMIGRSANVILVGSDGRLIDCMRRVDFAGDVQRSLLPGMIYRLPPKQDKTEVFLVTPEERAEALAGADRDAPMDKELLAQFSGLSPLICRELAFRCRGDWDTLPLQLEALAESVKAGETEPVMLLREGKPFDLSFMAISQYGAEITEESFESFSALLDAYYTRRDRLEQQRRRSRELKRSVKTARDRTAKKLQMQRQELQKTDEREQVRRRAELITANIYRLRRGERVLRCEDFFEEGCPEIEIPLDPLKTPQQNAAVLYKEYNKLKGAKEHLSVLVTENEKLLEYLESVLEEIERAETERDLGEIRRELVASGLLRVSKSKKTAREKPQAPLRFVTSAGLEVLVGRSNTQNDELTTKTARRTDLWLHAQKIHGSHVILRCDGLEPDDQSLREAASLAAWYSQGRGAGKIPVDYTMVRNVRKPSGALPGKVIYTEYSTLYAEGDEALAEKLRR